MSLDPHWYSTIYAVKKFVMAFYHGVTWITAIAIILYKLGYLPVLTKTHMQDFGRYIFALSIIWGYIWLSQYLLIWYANIPEETVYYVPRIMSEYKNYVLCRADCQLALPLPLPHVEQGEHQRCLRCCLSCLCLIVGQWIELYMSIMPEHNRIAQHFLD